MFRNVRSLTQQDDTKPPSERSIDASGGEDRAEGRGGEREYFVSSSHVNTTTSLLCVPLSFVTLHLMIFFLKKFWIVSPPRCVAPAALLGGGRESQG